MGKTLLTAQCTFAQHKIKRIFINDIYHKLPLLRPLSYRCHINLNRHW
ncbi:hypothetical protein EPYR_03115 [Erwinia pyrifoliae DSM 12163]|nr:hypothetical protein EJP617_18570 [Erwinia sp. Ejp617]CAY75495.1 hypothetical protein EPYR_03115 [Erwinia pyrifoliae DSM 12163]